MIEMCRAGPWPQEPFVVDLDAVGESPIDATALADLERVAGTSIGVVRGQCVGGALAVAMAVDLLVAGPTAQFGRPAGWTEIVVRRGAGIVGAKAIAYLAMSTQLIDARTAQMWGLVNVIDVDPGERARQLAESIATRSAVAVAAIRRQAHAGAAADHLAIRARSAATSAASAGATAR